MADIANPDLFVGPAWICLDMTRLPKKRKGSTQFATAVTAPPLLGCVVWTSLQGSLRQFALPVVSHMCGMQYQIVLNHAICPELN